MERKTKKLKIDIALLEQINKLYVEIEEINATIRGLDKIAILALNKQAEIHVNINAIETAPTENEDEPPTLLYVPTFGYFTPIQTPKARPTTRVMLPESYSMTVIQNIIAEHTLRKDEIFKEINSAING